MALAAFEETLDFKQALANESFAKLFSTILVVDGHVSALKRKQR